jgi:glycosyltransferase involved in cell wall biosynthesis
MYDWLDHTGLTADLYEYASTADNQPSTLLRATPSVLRAEWNLRRLGVNPSNRTILLSRQASPFSSGALEASLMTKSARGIYDFDDALYDDNESWTRHIWSKSRVWRRSVQAADIVIAGSNELANAASTLSDNVVMIPSCIEPGRYVHKSSYELHEVPRAVWIGSPATEPFLAAIAEPLLLLHKKFGLRVSVISAGSASLGSMDSIVDRVPWALDTFAGALADADFGVMPLADTSYARGKCSYKLLQYAATGLPLVGSPVGANAEVLQAMGGLAATSNSEWFDAMSSILELSVQKRLEMGSQMRRAAIESYSFAAWKETWLANVGTGY